MPLWLNIYLLYASGVSINIRKSWRELKMAAIKIVLTIFALIISYTDLWMQQILKKKRINILSLNQSKTTDINKVIRKLTYLLTYLLTYSLHGAESFLRS